ncbi:RND family transporter [Roseivirga sp. BDSF3-8]|uniref:efflux RND transporter permease subunit n=1 Tax=Roseivirga sp. BDSF3-8 TaxID=3241598 RepID=UPI003531B1B6
MWTKLAHIVFSYRLYLILLLAAITVFMGFQASRIELSYDFAKIVPSNDPDMVYFQEFRDLFGEDANILAVGVKDSALYEADNLRRYKALSDEITAVEGVKSVLSLPLLQRLERNSQEKRFDLVPLFPTIPESQGEVDSLLRDVRDQRFYTSQVVNLENGATLMLVAIEKATLNSEDRLRLVQDIVDLGDGFTENTGIKLHFAGLPFVRSIIASNVKDELNMFLMLSVLITGLILLFFYRSWDAVIFPLIMIGIMIVWSLGTIVLLGYKITLLTALIPPLIVVIGIPNSVYLLNKYHQEFNRHGNKMRALSRIIRKIGLATLITNSTTAIGFGVLAFTDITILREFGVVAGINIFATFFVSIIFIPAIFSYLPEPNTRKLKHLHFKGLDKFLTAIDLLVHRYRYRVFFITAVLVGAGVYGMYQIQSVSYMVDDIPEDSEIRTDLAFFEANFSGVMPLEIIVDTGKRRGVLRLSNLRKIEELEDFLADQEYLSTPVSVVSFIKAARQAFYNNNPAFYALPTNQDKNFILRYLREQSDSSGLLSSFVDSTGQKIRVSLKIADIGSLKMDSLIGRVVEPKVAEIFEGTDIEVGITGTTPLFIKGNNFLIDNLRTSLLLAFALISVIMAMLFGNIRMILISLVPNLVPLILTAGIMGFAGIPLKPSTALIFSIAFGISVDDSIHFLAKYRQELFANNFFVPLAISKSVRETGASMMYTSIILFAGFIIFAFSDFGGTVALGFLTSTTLLIAMFTNLILLPILLMTFDDGKRRKDFHPLIEHYEEFYHEAEDEEIDVDKIRVEKSEQGEGNS